MTSSPSTNNFQMDDVAVPVQEKLLRPQRTRLAVSLFYFGQGICFASWASRIPDIKHALNLSDAELGSILLALPLGQMITMPLSGKLVTMFGSRTILIATAPLYAVALTNLGLAGSGWQLAFFLFLFGIAGNMCNISLNTQGVAAEQLFDRPIMASFHGAWSLGGFTGALVGLLMLNLQQQPYVHFWIIGGLVWLHILINYKFLVLGQKPVADSGKRGFFMKPQGALLQLGIIGFAVWQQREQCSTGAGFILGKS